MTTGEWLANCSACCVPELAGAFTRARVPYRTVTGTLLDGDPAWDVARRLDRGDAALSRACAPRASGSSATTTRECSTCTRTSPSCTPRRACTSRCSRSTISSSESRPRTRRAIEQKSAEIRELFAFADPGARPDRRRDYARSFRLVGPRRGGPRPSRRGLRARRADLLLPRSRPATRTSGSAPD